MKSSSTRSKKQLSELSSILEDKSGRDIVSLDMNGLTIIADDFLIATGTSERHLQGMAREIIKHCKVSYKRNPMVSGFEGSGWILVDCGDIIVHLFREEIRYR